GRLSTCPNQKSRRRKLKLALSCISTARQEVTETWPCTLYRATRYARGCGCLFGQPVVAANARPNVHDTRRVGAVILTLIRIRVIDFADGAEKLLVRIVRQACRPALTAGGRAYRVA